MPQVEIIPTIPYNQIHHHLKCSNPQIHILPTQHWLEPDREEEPPPAAEEFGQSLLQLMAAQVVMMVIMIIENMTAYHSNDVNDVDHGGV